MHSTGGMLYLNKFIVKYKTRMKSHRGKPASMTGMYSALSLGPNVAFEAREKGDENSFGTVI